MGLRPAVIALGALVLSACASAEYAYCYDPYRGPVGYYTGPLDPKPACARSAVQAVTFVTHEGGAYRGAYVSGPYPASPSEAR